MTRVVNLRREPFDVYIGRAGHGHDGYFGNPYDGPSRADNLASYRTYFSQRIERDPEFRCRVLELRGKRLGCFCAPRECHGDVIREWLEDQEKPAV